MPSRFLSIPEAATLFGLSTDHLYKLIRNGEVPAYRISQRIIRINLADLVIANPGPCSSRNGKRAKRTTAAA